jgi:hypothetical protein
MASPEQRNFAEKTGYFIRNTGIVVALVGAIGILAGLTFPGEKIIGAGLLGAGLGQVGLQAAGAGSK